MARNESVDNKNKFMEEIRQMRKELDAMKLNNLKYFIVPVFATDPTGIYLVEGLLWYNSTSHNLKLRKNGSTVTVI